MTTEPPTASVQNRPMSPEARRALAHAIDFARAGRRDSARRAILAAVARSADDPCVSIVAGLVSFVVGDYHTSLEQLTRGGALGAGARVHWLVHERAARLGWDLDAREALRAGARMEPDEPRWHAALLTLYAHRRSPRAALGAGEAAVALAPHSAKLHMELAGIRAELGDRARAEAHLSLALDMSSTVVFGLEAGRVRTMLGDFAGAARDFSAVLERDDRNPIALRALADIALWSADDVSAERFARRLLDLGPSASAERILGTIAYHGGAVDEAEARFRASVSLDPSVPDAHAWLAQIAILAGRYDEGHAHVSASIEAGSGESFAGHVLRLRVKLEERPAESYPDRHAAVHLFPALRAICPELESVLRGRERPEWRILLDRVLARMRGNRSTTATYLDRGVLRLVPGIRDPRLESRRVLNRMRTDDLPGLLADFDRLADDFPDSGLPLAHKGELLLWHGRLDEAEAALERSLEIVRGTRWAHIGLGAIDLLRGDPVKSLATIADGVRVMLGTTGPAVFVHRGEALFRLDRLDEARVALETAVELNPSRLAGAILLALVSLAERNETRAFALANQVFTRAPGLVSDAARESGVPLTAADATGLDARTLRIVLEHTMHMFRGNRSSSCVSYFTREGRLRFVGRGGSDPHRRDATDLVLASHVLVRGVDALPRPGRA